MKFENLYIECENLEQRDEVFGVCRGEGHWQRGRPDFDGMVEL